MTTRLVEQPARAQVQAVPRCWQRGGNRLAVPTEPRVPEPAQLYSLIAVTFTLHVALPRSGQCECCGQPWPCEPVRLAFRLREGF
jgi:hypothetical protein